MSITFATRLTNPGLFTDILKGIDLLRIKGYLKFQITTPSAKIQLLPELQRRAKSLNIDIEITPGIICEESPLPGYDPFTFFMWSKYKTDANWLSSAFKGSSIVFDLENLLELFYKTGKMDYSHFNEALNIFNGVLYKIGFRYLKLTKPYLKETVELTERLVKFFPSAEFSDSNYNVFYSEDNRELINLFKSMCPKVKPEYRVSLTKTDYHNIEQIYEIIENTDDDITIFVDETEWLDVIQC